MTSYCSACGSYVSASDTHCSACGLPFYGTGTGSEQNRKNLRARAYYQFPWSHPLARLRFRISEYLPIIILSILVVFSAAMGYLSYLFFGPAYGISSGLFIFISFSVVAYLWITENRVFFELIYTFHFYLVKLYGGMIVILLMLYATYFIADLMLNDEWAYKFPSSIYTPLCLMVIFVLLLTVNLYKIFIGPIYVFIGEKRIKRFYDENIGLSGYRKYVFRDWFGIFDFRYKYDWSYERYHEADSVNIKDCEYSYKVTWNRVLIFWCRDIEQDPVHYFGESLVHKLKDFMYALKFRKKLAFYRARYCIYFLVVILLVYLLESI